MAFINDFYFFVKDSINEVQRDTAIDSRFDNDDDEEETPPPKTKKVNARRNRPVSSKFFNYRGGRKSLIGIHLQGSITIIK